MNSIAKQQELYNLNLNSKLRDDSSLSDLLVRLDNSEKSDDKPFHDFSDIEMMQWFLYERKHLNEENDRTKETTREYQRELSMFVEQLLSNSIEIDVDLDHIVGGSLFKSLEKRHLRRYQQWLATKSPYVLATGSYSAATLERKTAIIKAFFAFLYKVSYISKPVHEGFKIATVRKDDRPNRDLGPEDVIRLLNTYKEINHPIMFTIIQVLTTTGIRNAEFCTLCVKDMKVDTIQGGYYLDVLGKGNKRRQVPLKQKVVDSIRTFRRARGVLPLEQANGEEPLFTTNSGRAYSPSYLAQYVKSQIKKHCADKQPAQHVIITPHVFRHAFAIISKLNGVEIYDIMRSLGHEKIETTMIYLEKVFEKERHAIHQWKPESFGQYI